jgi:hypothetical protein
MGGGVDVFFKGGRLLGEIVGGGRGDDEIK